MIIEICTISWIEYIHLCFLFFQGDLVTCGVLSGNKNFEGRLCDCVRANYLASPPLVVAYAIAGTVNIDFQTEPLGIFSFICIHIYLHTLFSPKIVLWKCFLDCSFVELFQEILSRCIINFWFIWRMYNVQVIRSLSCLHTWSTLVE